MRRVFLLPALALAAGFAASPAAAQSARASVTASATVVERIAFSAGRTTVAPARGGLDVTTPLSVQGRAAYVVQVLSDEQPNAGARIASAKAADGRTVDVDLRVSAAEARERPERALTYVISTVN